MARSTAERAQVGSATGEKKFVRWKRGFLMTVEDYLYPKVNYCGGDGRAFVTVVDTEIINVRLLVAS